MKLIAENPPSLQYFYDPKDQSQVWYFGDYLRKVTSYMKDSEEKDKLHCEVNNVQNTDWPTVEAYEKALKRSERDITNHLGTHEDPFIIT